MEKLRCSTKSLIPVIVCLTILTYVDLFPDIIRYNLSYIVWIVAVAEGIITCHLDISKRAFQYILGAVFFGFFLLVMGFTTGQNYFGGTVYSVALALMVFLCGCIVGNKYMQEDVYVICRWFVIASIIAGVIVFLKGIGIGFNLNSQQSFGVNKNSVGQILSSAVCILIVGLKWPHKKILISIRIVIILFLSLTVFLIRSRTSILCFGVAILYIVLSKYTNRRVRRGVIAGTVVIFIVIMFNSTLRNTLIYNILLANRDASSLNAITSGRIDIYGSFGTLIKGHELTGIGATYYESFYLSNIVQFGWIFGIYLDFYALWMVDIIRNTTKMVTYHQLLYTIAISYTLNGLFEGLPPFGPGTKNLLLWLLFGIATTHSIMGDKIKNLEQCTINNKGEVC